MLFHGWYVGLVIGQSRWTRVCAVFVLIEVVDLRHIFPFCPFNFSSTQSHSLLLYKQKYQKVNKQPLIQVYTNQKKHMPKLERTSEEEEGERTTSNPSGHPENCCDHYVSLCFPVFPSKQWNMWQPQSNSFSSHSWNTASMENHWGKSNHHD